MLLAQNLSRRACHIEPIFSTKERRPLREHHRHTATAKELVTSNAVHIATRIAVHAMARVTTRIAVHVIARIVTAYTDTTKRYREAVYVDLCTLLCFHVCL